MSKKISALSNVVFDKWDKSHTQYKRKQAEDLVNSEPEALKPDALLEWAERHPFLKVVKYKVPEGIFPEGVTAHLNDIQTLPPRRKREKILDDDIYDAFYHIRTYVPRGCCILQVQTNEKKITEIVVFALKKFTGGPGDDDDLASLLEEETERKEEIVEEETQQARERWEHYFIESPSKAKYIIRTSKENGEAAHVSQFRYEGELYYVFGSKNVHLIIKKSEDLQKYTESRFLTARMIAETMLDRIVIQKDEKIRWFMDYMHEKKLSANFEFLNVKHQHVELFDFTESKYRFITFTSLSDLKKLCTDDFQGSIAIAKEAGFETIASTRYEADLQNHMFDKIRSEYGKEGSVLYYYSSNQCIGMVKKKSAWYVCLRAIREKIRPFAKRVEDGEIDEGKLRAVKRRLRSTMRQKQDWIGFDDAARNSWIQLAEAFTDWIFANITAKKIKYEQVYSLYPVIWNQFLSEKNLSDRIQVIVDVSRVGRHQKHEEDGEEADEDKMKGENEKKSRDNDGHRPKKRFKYEHNGAKRGRDRGRGAEKCNKNPFDFRS